jgi:Beta-propeller repeat
MKKYVFIFVAAIFAFALCNLDDISDARITLADITKQDSSLLQFKAGNHVLGFAPDKAYLASIDHSLIVRFLGTRGAKPKADMNTVATGVMTSAPLLTRVIYQNLWDGISLTYEPTRDGITESTYHIAAGADVSDIRMRYNAPVDVQKDGSLKLKFSRGYITESAPRAWQDIDGRHENVRVAFYTAHEEVGFSVGRYNHRYPLVIDPTYSWNTFYGGSGTYNYGYGMALDSSGNIYVTGWSNSTWNGPDGQSPLNAYSNVNNLFVVKLNKDGGYLWHTFYGNGSSGQSIAVDGSGNVYVTGYSTYTWNGPSGEQPLHATGSIHILKLNTNGAYQWHTFYGSTTGYGIAVDSGGTVYVCGAADTAWTGPSGEAPLNPYPGQEAIFVLSLNSSGAYRWHTFYGGSVQFSGSVGNGIALDGSGNLYVAGYAWPSWNGPSGEAPLNPATGTQDIVVLKLDTNGAYKWHTFYGANIGAAAGYGIAADSGKIYITGYTNANSDWNGPSGQAPLNHYSGTSDIVILKLHSAGGYQWHTFYGPSNGGYGITVKNNNVYVAGYSYTTWDIGPSLNGGSNGIAILDLGGNGSYRWHALYGSGGNQDTAHGIAVDDGGNIFVSGQGKGTWGTPLHAFSGSQNIFAMKMGLTTYPDHPVKLRIVE